MINAVSFGVNPQGEPMNMNLQFPGQIPPQGYPMGQTINQCSSLSQASVERMAEKDREFYQAQLLIKEREEERRKTEMLKLEARQRLREVNEARKMLQRLTVFENRDGQLRLDVDGVVKVVSEVTEARSFRLKHYFTREMGFPSVYEVMWEGCKRKNVFFSVESFDPRNLLKVLEKNGVVFSISNSLRKSFSVTFYEYLLRNEMEVLLPITHGWQNLDGIWKFVTSEELTMEKLYERNDTIAKIGSL